MIEQLTNLAWEGVVFICAMVIVVGAAELLAEITGAFLDLFKGGIR